MAIMLLKIRNYTTNYDTGLHCFKITTLYYYTRNDYQYYNEFFKHTSDVKMFLFSNFQNAAFIKYYFNNKNNMIVYCFE